MTLRLALLVNHPSKGTYANLVARLALGLAQTGRSETALVCYQSDKPPDWLPPDVRVHQLGTGRASRSLNALVRYLHAEQPDVLVTRPVHVNFLGLAATGIARVSGWSGKLVVGHDHPAALSHASNFLDNKWVVKASYRFADGVIAVSPTVREDVIRWSRLPDSKVALIPNPIAPFPGREPKAPHPWLEDEAPPVFVTAGRLVRYKRMDLLIDAFSELLRRCDARLLIVGEGPERARLSRQIESLEITDRAQTVGWVPDPLQFFSRAAAFVLASEEEGFSQVLTEAMSTGCPVIAADALGGGPRFVTDGGRYGLLVPRGDRKRLVEAMEWILAPDVRADFVQLGLERIRIFSPAACGNALVDFLESTVCAGRGSR